MRKHIFYLIVLVLGFELFGSLASANTKAKPENTDFGAIAKAESLIPIHPGEPGKTAFWNGSAQQFIYAPAFDYKIIDGAKQYLYKITCEDNTSHNFINKVPYAALSDAWKSMPTGLFKLQVIALNASGDSIGLSGSGKYYKAAYFNGPYHEPVMPYDQSAVLALEQLMKKDYVEYWLTHHVPDPKYINYRYPAKIYSALVIGAITYAKLKPGTDDATRSIKLANIVADYMLEIRFKEGTSWEFFVPTYYGPHAENALKDHLKPINSFSIMGVDAGNAFLDLYDFSGEEKYLEAAKKIADTYLKRQLDNGSWYQFVNHETGDPTADNIVIPTSVINYFDRLKTNYGVNGLDISISKTFQWIMDNPVKTFNWQGQFEDVKALPPYKNLSREQACDLAIYLFRNKKEIKLAEELVRFSEDQFVIWEKPKKIAYQQPQHKGGKSENWITPSVQEQFVFWMPVGRSAAIMIEAYWEAYAATKKEIYLAKAKSIANAFTLVQKAHNGDYPTFFTQYPMNKWLNSTVYPAKTMMSLENNIKGLN